MSLSMSKSTQFKINELVINNDIIILQLDKLEMQIFELFINVFEYLDI
jgi:hypothetical protein